MLLGEPQTSDYDWQFQIFGFQVRVTWLFWAIAAAFGYNEARSLHEYFTAVDMNSNFALLLLLWIVAAFASILIHELGHAFAFRFYGIDSHIVLYQMGGLAIPGAGLIWGRQGRRTTLTDSNQIVISAAGPAIQILAALIVGTLGMLMGLNVHTFQWVAGLLQINIPSMPPPSNVFVHCAVNFFVNLSIWWAILNLVPVFPLDGGQINRHVIGAVTGRDGLITACQIGMIVSLLMAVWLYQSLGAPIAALMFVSLAFSNYQILQAGRGGMSGW